ncbi:BamA/TamA family outer membrane protein [bacterium]|nr:BamA/TamA family outer membrane protein [bacterium]
MKTNSRYFQLSIVNLKLTFLCLTLIFFPLALFPQTPVVTKIKFTGNHSISSSKLQSVIQTRETLPLNEDVLNGDAIKILNFYQSKLFYLASIDSITRLFNRDSSAVDVFFFVTENRPIKVDSVAIEGVELLPQQTIYNAWSLTGQIFDPAILDENLQNFLSLYERNGFPFTKIEVTGIHLFSRGETPLMTIRISVNEGEPVIIRKITVTGQSETKETVLLRELNLKLPLSYDQKVIDDAIIRLKKLSFIQNVATPELLYLDDSSYALKIQITEGSANTIDGVAGYVPKQPGSDEKGYFTGLFNVSFQNLFGSARQLEARWQKKNRYSQDFYLAYTEPWVLNYPVNLGASLQQIVQDTIYVERTFSLDGSVLLGKNTRGLFGGKQKTIDPAGWTNSFLFNIPSATFYSGYIGFSYDTRDDRINPRSGLFYKTLLEYGKKDEILFAEIAGGTDTLHINGVPVVGNFAQQKLSTQKISIDVETYWPLTRKLVLFNGTHGYVYKTPQSVVPYSEQFLFGGLHDLRGYTEDFFNGTRIGWNNFELRWLTSRQSRIFVFWDAGYYYRKEYAPGDQTRVITEDGWPIGYGFGIRFQTRLGLFALDYGLGKGDSFNNGKVHFGIATEF